MNLTDFGQKLQMLRKEAGLSQQQVGEALDRLAQTGSTEDYRVIDSTLISRWEGARVSKGRHWKPTRPYVLHLIHLFQNQLDLESASSWASFAGYQVSRMELQPFFPPLSPVADPVHDLSAGEDQLSIKRGIIPSNIPKLLTSFIGRQEQIATIRQWLADPRTRLITIAGEGGMGKSRLALVIAQSIVELPLSLSLPSGADHPARSSVLMSNFGDGIWFVPLAGLTAGTADWDVGGIANRLATAIAKTLNFSFGSMDVEPCEQLINYLHTKRQLLILDNFEHMTMGTPFVLDLLQQAPQICVLITSRIALNCQAERLLQLQGLPTSTREPHDGDDLPSIQLFIERARQQEMDFSPDAETLQGIDYLCRLVNGNPLAVELLANWIQHFTVAEMITALQQQERILLVTDQQDVPVRHRSMEAVFETSWQFLPATSQMVLAHLAIFRGPFSRDAALAVANATINDLVLLADHSLLQVGQEATRPKTYIMHELLRQLALTKLMALDAILSGLAQRAYQGHSDFYLRFLGERGHARYSSKVNIAVAEVNAFIDNIRAAWQWAVTYRDVAGITQAWIALRDFYHVRSLYQEGEEVFRGSAAHLYAANAANPEVIMLGAGLQTAQAFFLNLLHRYDAAINVAHAVMTRLQGQEDSAVTADAQLEWGIALSQQSEYEKAQIKLAEAVQLADSLQLPAVAARALHSSYRVLVAKGEFGQAATALEQALLHHRQLGNRLDEGFELRALGIVAYHQHQFKTALEYFEQSLAVFEAFKDQARIISIWMHLGDVYNAFGSLGHAYHYYLAAYTQRKEAQDIRYAANTVEAFGRFWARLGDYRQACKYSQEALTLHRHLGNHLGEIETFCTLGWVFHQLGDVATTLAYYRDALEISEEFGNQIYKGLAWLGIGKALAKLDNKDEAIANYHQALQILRRQKQQGWVLETLSELAHVAMMQDRLAEAHVFINEVFTGLDDATLNGALDPLRIYLICYQVLQANHDPRAVQLLHIGYHRMQREAATLDHEELRQSFLSHVTTNRELVELHRHMVGRAS